MILGKITQNTSRKITGFFVCHSVFRFRKPQISSSFSGFKAHLTHVSIRGTRPPDFGGLVKTLAF
jgi:hypothetical protein